MGKAMALALADPSKAEEGELAHLPGESELKQAQEEIESRGVRTFAHGLPVMIESGWGRIINIASTAASVGATP